MGVDAVTGGQGTVGFAESALRFAREDMGVRVRRRLCLMGVDDMSIAGDILSDAADESSSTYVPMVSDGRVPGWVDGDSDCILMSYDGSCPEMLRAFDVLLRRGCGIVCITSGGPLAERCAGGTARLLQVPAGMSGMEAAGPVLGILASIVQSSSIFPAVDLLEEAVESVRVFGDSVPELADRVAGSIRGKVVASYSTSDIRACSRRWRQSLDACTGELSFCGELPEFDHNELVGWSDPNEHAPELTMAVIRGCREDGLVSDIVRCMLEVLDDNGRCTVVAEIGDGGSMGRNLRAVVAADAVSAILGGARL